MADISQGYVGWLDHSGKTAPSSPGPRDKDFWDSMSSEAGEKQRAALTKSMANPASRARIEADQAFLRGRMLSQLLESFRADEPLKDDWNSLFCSPGCFVESGGYGPVYRHTGKAACKHCQKEII